MAPALESADPTLIAWETMKCEPTSFVDPELDPYHTDLLFSVGIAGAPAYIYFLLEHQSTTDHDMPYRVLEYLMRVWDHDDAQQRELHPKRTRRSPIPLIVAIVISNVQGGWKGPLSFHDLCEPHPSSLPCLENLVPHFSLLLLDLSEVSNDDLSSWALAAFPKAALFALRDARDPVKLLQDFEHWGALMTEASQAPSGMEAIRQLMRYLALASPNLNMAEFRAKIRKYLPKAETELMTIYEQAHQEGLQAGRQEGRQEGLQAGRQEGLQAGRQEGRQAGLLEGQVRTLAKQLVSKFGELPNAYAARLQAASSEDLDRYVERILTADSLASVFGDPA